MFKNQSGKLLMVSAVNDLGDYECEGLFGNQEEAQAYHKESLDNGYVIGDYKLYKLVEA